MTCKNFPDDSLKKVKGMYSFSTYFLFVISSRYDPLSHSLPHFPISLSLSLPLSPSPSPRLDPTLGNLWGAYLKMKESQFIANHANSNPSPKYIPETFNPKENKEHLDICVRARCLYGWIWQYDRQPNYVDIPKDGYDYGSIMHYHLENECLVPIATPLWKKTPPADRKPQVKVTQFDVDSVNSYYGCLPVTIKLTHKIQDKEISVSYKVHINPRWSFSTTKRILGLKMGFLGPLPGELRKDGKEITNDFQPFALIGKAVKSGDDLEVYL